MTEIPIGRPGKKKENLKRSAYNQTQKIVLASSGFVAVLASDSGGNTEGGFNDPVGGIWVGVGVDFTWVLFEFYLNFI